MKTYMLTLLISLTFSNTLFAQVKLNQDFVTQNLFFEEALGAYSENIDLSSVQITKDLSGVSKLKLSNFDAKSTHYNTKETSYETYDVQFKMKDQKHQVSCLGTILKIDHPIMELDQAKEFDSRSGRVLLSECSVSDAKDSENFPPGFVIDHYVSFPLVSSLPISYGSAKERYNLSRNIDVTKNKAFQCVSRDMTANGPRKVLSVYSLKDHFALGIQIGQSNSVDAAADIPVDTGEVDLGSLPWLKDNITFFKSLSDYGSTFNVIFPKSDCVKMGNTDNIVVMSCSVTIPKDNQVKGIERVMFNFETQMVTKPIIPDFIKPDEPMQMKSVLEFKANVKFVLDQQNKYYPIFKKTHYQTEVSFSNEADKGRECIFSKEVDKPQESNKYLSNSDVAT